MFISVDVHVMVTRARTLTDTTTSNSTDSVMNKHRLTSLVILDQDMQYQEVRRLVLVRARTVYTYLLQGWMDRYMYVCVFGVSVSARLTTNTHKQSNYPDQHKHRHVTTPKGAKRLLKMACNKVCMTARCVQGGKEEVRFIKKLLLTFPSLNTTGRHPTLYTLILLNSFSRIIR